MTVKQSRRSVLKVVISSVCSSLLLPGCGTGESKPENAARQIREQLRHHGVAAHLGRLEVEANPKLKSMTPMQLTADVLSSIDLDINAINDAQIDSISERISTRIRQDFTDEAVTTVDGWLLSVTEAKACALVFLDITQSSG